MAGKIVIVLLLAGLLFFGCTGPSESKEVSPPTGSVSNDSAPEVEEPSSGETSDGATDSEPEEEQPTGGTDELAGKTYEELSALGVPLECDTSVSYEGTATMSKIYMKGELVRIETPISDSQSTCDDLVYITKDNAAYMGCEDGSIFGDVESFADCNWLEFSDVEGSAAGDDEHGYSYQVTTPDLKSTAEVSCKPWIYDPSKFDTPGKVCNMEDMMEQMINEAYQPPD